MRKYLLALALVVALCAGEARACHRSASFAVGFGVPVNTFASTTFFSSGFSTFGVVQPTNAVFVPTFATFGGSVAVAGGGFRRSNVAVSSGVIGGGASVAVARGGLFGRRTSVAVSAGDGGASVAVAGRGRR